MNIFQFGAYPGGIEMIKETIRVSKCKHFIHMHNFKELNTLYKGVEPYELIKVRHAPYYKDIKLSSINGFIRNELMRHSDIFTVLIKRTHEYKKYSQQDCDTLFLKMGAYWYNMLRKNDINVALFSEIPHRGIDYVLYLLCRIMGIPIHLAIRFAYRAKMANEEEPIGLVDLVSGIEYIGDAFWFDHLHPSDVEERINSEGHGFLKDSLEILNGKTETSHWKPTGKPKVLEHISQDYMHYYEKHVKPVKWNVPFIFFGLHFQPEANTCPQGGKFHSLTYVCDILSRAFPQHKIYVKEHPYPSRNRSENFYDRMLANTNVQFVPMDTNPIDLIMKSEAVATVTGTIGWEAILRRKQCISFGHSYYANAPGVFTVNQEWPLESCKKIAKYIKKKYWVHDITKKEMLSFIWIMHCNSYKQTYDDLKPAILERLK